MKSIIPKYQIAGSKEMGFTVLENGFRLLGEFDNITQARNFIKELKENGKNNQR